MVCVLQREYTQIRCRLLACRTSIIPKDYSADDEHLYNYSVYRSERLRYYGLMDRHHPPL